MAIIIQENGSNKMMIPLIIGVVILIAAAFIMYQLFFSIPPKAEIVETEGYKSATIFSQASLDVEAVVNSPAWDSLSKESSVPPLMTEVASPKENIFRSFKTR
jgi:flagellar basal body-associated protein FliL